LKTRWRQLIEDDGDSARFAAAAVGFPEALVVDVDRVGVRNTGNVAVII
jgi:hypothetical protein